MTADTKFKVLIVDDEPESLLVLEMFLESLDCTLYKTTSGQEAVNMTIEHEGFDLILLDIKMPDMHGYRVAELIRERFKSIPIIFLTASHKDDRDVVRGYEVGATDYLMKPVDRGILLKKVQDILALDIIQNSI